VDSDDEEFEYDSDEDDIQILLEKHQHNGSTGQDLSEDSKALLLWRQDKDESFSDWTIEVSVANKSKVLYHVHKTCLATGPKKSGYFEALLKSGRFSESTNNISQVDLPEDVAVGFPAFLDYLYSQPYECARLVTRENWYSLRKLAQYFIVPKLANAVQCFIEADMHDLNRMEMYLVEFRGAEDDEAKQLLSVATRICAENILNIESDVASDSCLLVLLTPAMLLHMMNLVGSSGVILSLLPHLQDHICCLVLSYVNHHRDSLNEGYFLALTSELHFPDDPRLAAEVAIDLLEIMKLTEWVDSTSAGGLMEICAALVSRHLQDMPDPSL